MEESMVLNLQMIADHLEELLWDYRMEAGEDPPRFRCCQVYWGQEELQEDAVYLVPLSGGAEQLDMTLRELSRERALPVVLVDCGLTAAGRQRTELLTGGAGAVLVTPQQLTDLYTKKENAQGR